MHGQKKHQTIIFVNIPPEYSWCTILMKVCICAAAQRRNGLPVICKHYWDPSNVRSILKTCFK